MTIVVLDTRFMSNGDHLYQRHKMSLRHVNDLLGSVSKEVFSLRVVVLLCCIIRIETTTRINDENIV